VHSTPTYLIVDTTRSFYRRILAVHLRVCKLPDGNAREIRSTHCPAPKRRCGNAVVGASVVAFFFASGAVTGYITAITTTTTTTTTTTCVQHHGLRSENVNNLLALLTPSGILFRVLSSNGPGTRLADQKWFLRPCVPYPAGFLKPVAVDRRSIPPVPPCRWDQSAQSGGSKSELSQSKSSNVWI
jgi:hypothetical protein